MALNVADKVLIDFAINRLNEKNIKNNKSDKISNVSDIAKELNSVFETREREKLIKNYAVKKLFLFDENVLIKNYDVDFNKKTIIEKQNNQEVLNILAIYEEFNESLKCIGSNVKLYKS